MDDLFEQEKEVKKDLHLFFCGAITSRYPPSGFACHFLINEETLPTYSRRSCPFSIPVRAKYFMRKMKYGKTSYPQGCHARDKAEEARVPRWLQS